MEIMSNSEKWRQRGNKHYDMAHKSASAPEQTVNYKKAIHCFEKAYEESDTGEEAASAAKNLAMTYWKLTNKMDENDDSDDEVDESDVYYQKALRQFTIARERGESNKTSVWMVNLTKDMRSCIHDSLGEVDGLSDPGDKLLTLNRIVDIITDGPPKAICYVKLANIMYQEGLRALARTDFHRALDLFKESHRPIELANENDKSINITELKQNIKRKTRIGEAMQIIQTGKALREEACRLTEADQELKVEIVYGAVDAFREAITITNEKELEIEAMSLSHLGVVYDKLLQQPDKAKEYFMRCVQLTEAMPNQSFVLQDWYSACTQTLERYQQSTVNKEERSKRDIIKNELQAEMKILDEARTKYMSDIPGRLLFISEKFPPTKRTFVLPVETELRSKSMPELKSITRKLVMDYHADKQKTKERKLQILNEEITKFINDILERIKCAD